MGIEAAVKRHDLKTVEALARRAKPQEMERALQYAIGTDTEIALALIRAGAAEKPDAYLWMAAQRHNLVLVRELVERGANPTTGFNGIHSPLMEAAESVETTRLLLDLGADPNWEARKAEGAFPETPLIRSLARRRYAVAELLLSRGANPDAQYHYGELWTPLMIAGMNGDVEGARLLLEHGANPLMRDRKGQTAAEHARKGREFAGMRKRCGEVLGLIEGALKRR